MKFISETKDIDNDTVESSADLQSDISEAYSQEIEPRIESKTEGALVGANDQQTIESTKFIEEIISDSKLMKGYYDDYSPSRALEILRAIPTAWSQYEKFGGRWGPGIIGKLVNLNATTTGRYLHAFRKAEIKEIEGPTGEKITMP